MWVSLKLKLRDICVWLARGGVLPYICLIGMCRPKWFWLHFGYVWVRIWTTERHTPSVRAFFLEISLCAVLSDTWNTWANVVFHPKHPKWDQNLQFTPQRETTSITVTLTWVLSGSFFPVCWQEKTSQVAAACSDLEYRNTETRQ